MTDITHTLIAERGDRTDSELVAWAEAVSAGIESFGHDLDVTFPWARLVFGKHPSDRATTPEQDLGSTAIARSFLSFPTLRETPDRCEAAIHELTTLRARLAADTAAQKNGLAQIDAMIKSLTRSAAAAEALCRRNTTLITQTKTIFDAMEFGFLFDPTRKLFSIGYRVPDSSLDPSCYDLLASEARLTSFVAIAKGDVPSTHWFHLGRALTPVDQGTALVSWRGSIVSTSASSSTSARSRSHTRSTTSVSRANGSCARRGSRPS
jgi:cyclic beta-1,2-glucan synthetase